MMCRKPPHERPRMSVPFRLIDSGIRAGRLQIAYDQALIDLHRDGRVPDTVRFLRFHPTVLVGRHQAVAHEVKVEDCFADLVDIVRRITGGGAIYLDEKQVGWELVLSRKRLPMASLGDYTKAICDAVAFGLSSSFGVNAQFRPRNDIEVDGQKICGTGGFFDGDTLIYQGTVLVDVDPARVMSYLNIPEAKLKKRDLDKAENRITTLRALLGEAPSVEAVHAALLKGFSEKLGLTITPGTVSDEETALSLKYHADEIGSDEFVYSIDDPRQPLVREASHTGPGGTVTAFLRTDGVGAGERIREVLITGDFFVTPPRLILDLEAALRGQPTAAARDTVQKFFAAAKPGMLTITPADFEHVVTAALAQ
jgi:lipoate---protein ligase